MKQYSIQLYKKAMPSEEGETSEILSDLDLSDLSSVFVDGELKQLDIDYTIQDGKIVFNDLVNELANVSLIYDMKTQDNLMGVKKTNSVFGQYDSGNKLKTNNKYTVNINIDKENYTWQFNSKQNPMFSSAKKIYEDIGEFIEGYTEEYINNKIYENSVEVIELIDSLANEGVNNVTYEIDDNGFYTTNYRYISNWVRYKTDIELTLARYFGISAHYGSELKEIGDIKIEKSTKLPYIDNLLDALKLKFEAADEAIKGNLVSVSAVKAGTRYKYDDWKRDTTFEG